MPNIVLLNLWLSLILFELSRIGNSISWDYLNGDCSINCDFKGDDFSIVYALHLDDCMMKCYHSDQTCTNFVYYDNSDGNFNYKYCCYLKNGNKQKIDAETDYWGSKYCGLRTTGKNITERFVYDAIN